MRIFVFYAECAKSWFGPVLVDFEVQDFDRPKNDRRCKTKVGEVIFGKMAQNTLFPHFAQSVQMRKILILTHFGSVWPSLESLRLLVNKTPDKYGILYL